MHTLYLAAWIVAIIIGGAYLYHREGW